MKVKLRIQSMDEFELDLSEAKATMPIIRDRIMTFGAYGVSFEMTDNIWYQLQEEYKKKIYNHNLKKFVKYMLITITDITAYSFSFAYHDKLKDDITMEELYENFDSSREIEFFLPACDFPNSSMSIYFQYLGEIYVEFELDDLVAISEKESTYDFFSSEILRNSKRRKEREKSTGQLEQLYNEQLGKKNK